MIAEFFKCLKSLLKNWLHPKNESTFKCELWQPRKDFLDEAFMIKKFLNVEYSQNAYLNEQG